jgi:AcrR family transcriptional regulator
MNIYDHRMTARKYTLKQRAERQERTRERIVEAAMALHQEIGPSRTTISAVAERAGVQRLTVYRHFPSDSDLFAACTSTWLGRNPPPAAAPSTAGDALAQVRATLEAFYRYYRRTAQMWKSAHRDVDAVPALAAPMREFEAYLAAVAEELSAALEPAKGARMRVVATLRHALAFSTWRSLSEQRLGDAAMARLVTEWVAASGGGRAD